MALIERTIYPRIHKKITKKELLEEYTPSQEELTMAYFNLKTGNKVFTFMVLLKTFKKLRYFPKVDDIPNEIIQHIK